MSKSFIDDLIEKLISSGLATPDEIIGCTDSEIERLAANQNIWKFPALYRELLQKMGKKAGHYFQGVGFFHADLPELKLWANVLLRESAATFWVVDDTFVFLDHQGYEFYYFYTNTSQDDPPIYYYHEGDKTATKRWEHLSDFLTEEFEKHAKVKWS
jgi:SMI1-KNR4 cell-wall